MAILRILRDTMPTVVWWLVGIGTINFLGWLLDFLDWLPAMVNWYHSIPSGWVWASILVPLGVGIALRTALHFSDKKLRSDILGNMPDISFRAGIEIARKYFKGLEDYQIIEQLIFLAHNQKITVWGKPEVLQSLIISKSNPMPIPFQCFFSPNFGETVEHGFKIDVSSTQPGWEEGHMHWTYGELELNQGQLQAVLYTVKKVGSIVTR